MYQGYELMVLIVQTRKRLHLPLESSAIGQTREPAGLDNEHVMIELFLAGQHQHAASMPLH